MRALCEGALAVAREVVSTNRALHSALAAELEAEEKMEGAALQASFWVVYLLLVFGVLFLLFDGGLVLGPGGGRAGG